jgi:hypothetical protein
MGILRAWYVLQGEPGDEEPIIREAEIGVKGGPKRIAGVLRADLKKAGVTRAILFEDEAENVEPLRFHDLRSTFCSWARRAGKSDAWISERTGHDLDGKMISRYDRGAQTLADLDYAPFPDIARAVPELVEIRARLHTRLHTDEEAQKVEASETVMVPEAWVVGAIGVEPTTPTVSTQPSRRFKALRDVAAQPH